MTTRDNRTGPAHGRDVGGVALAALAGLFVIAAGCATPSSTDAEGVATQPASPPSGALHHDPVVILPRPGTERLARGEHPFARPENDQGRLDPDRRIANLSLFFRPSPAQRRDRDELAAAQLDPKSPLFHKWLVPATYNARFGARPDDIARARDWLAAQGFEVHRTSPLGNRVTFSAKVRDLEAAFQTEMHRYMVGTEVHYAMATSPAMPSELAPIVLGLRNTHDFFPKPLFAKALSAAMAHGTPAQPHPDFTFNPLDGGGPDGSIFNVLGPPDWAAAYDVAKLYSPGIGGKSLDGTGVIIGIVGTAQIADSDIQAFRQTFGLPANTVTMTLVPDTGPAAAGYGAGAEAILDTEWSGGVAKGANVNYVFTGQDDGNVDDGTSYLIEENLAPLMSESYGGCELGLTPADADITEEFGTAANIMGITYMASSGDSGADGCLDYGILGIYACVPDSYPGVTSVGGTQFPSPVWNKAGDLTGYPSVEAVWNESNDPFAVFTYMGMTYPVGVGAGGGGISSAFARPAYQQDVPACDVIGSLPYPASQPMRQTPDISVSAASGTPGYYVACTFSQTTGDCTATGGNPQGTVIGGTSASSPSFTGLVAILNQAVGERLGNINPMLYELAAAAKTPSPFHDITVGSNAVVCGQAAADAGAPPDGSTWPDSGCSKQGLEGFNAAPGYDCASGLGSIDGLNLVTAWIGAAATTMAVAASPTMVSEGTPVTLTATITVATPNATAVTGNVTFAFESFDTNGQLDLDWELGTVAITNGTTAGATAVLTTNVPPGIARTHQFDDVAAFYGGDLTHLASSSPVAVLSFAPVTFALSPEKVFLGLNDPQQFTSTGGVPPVTWYVAIDTTAEISDYGQYIGGSQLDPTTGAFVAGPQPGYTLIEALDNDGAEALAYITIGSPQMPAPWLMDGGMMDAGKIPATRRDAAVADTGARRSTKPDAGVDSGGPPQVDSGHSVDARAGKDGGEDTKPAGADGCSCEVGTGRSSRPVGRVPVGALSGLLPALGLVVRRTKRR